MRKSLSLLLALLLLRPACAPDAGDSDARTLKRIGKALSLDLSAGTLERLENTHGGFHGDGRTAAEITLPGLAGTLADAPGWRPLPPSESMAQALRLCGMDTPSEAGFYYLYDRHSDSRDPYDDSLLHQRYSWNFTAAVYDSGAGRLYYYEFDT